MQRAKNIIIAVICGCLLGCFQSPKPLPQRVFEQPETGVYGQVKADSDPAASIWVYAYRSQLGGFRGPADFAARVDEDGRYLLDLLPGRWFLVARSRQQGPLTGPPQTGDAWEIYQKNPLILQPDETRRVDFQLQQVAPALVFRAGNLSRGETGFSGRLIGPDGQPVVGAIALAYQDQDYRRMPDHSSGAVSADGHFRLYVASPGKYCLVAREGTRGQPRQGELYGLLGAGEAGCRELAKEEMLDIGEIHLRPYLR